MGSRLEGTDDYLSDQGLANIEALIPKIPQGFTISVQTYSKSIVVTFRFDRPAAVMARADQPYALIEAAMCVDTLCKNLRAEREANRG